jgi:hypothetical protein
MKISIDVRQRSDGYVARHGKIKAQCTSGPEWAAKACAAKVFGCRSVEVMVVPVEPIRKPNGYDIYPCGEYIAEPKSSKVPAN